MPAHFDIYQDEQGQWRWTAKAANGEIVASGESYTSETDARRGFEDATRTMLAATPSENNDSDEP